YGRKNFSYNFSKNWIIFYLLCRYAQYGDVSPKVDVYAIGVVLYELISAKEAVFKAYDSTSESKSLVALFEDVFNQPDPRDDLRKVVDPRLGDDYPLDSVGTVAQLANACTQKDTRLRPSMRSIVVALIILSSTAEDLEVGSFYENQALLNLMFRKELVDLFQRERKRLKEEEEDTHVFLFLLLVFFGGTQVLETRVPHEFLFHFSFATSWNSSQGLEFLH
ncbi:chitin elicitor receptor kinase 1-like, partial [Quercus suber]|uniref:chitin elicitor receptor kinase 1-like n=1 Tax=Quercus suber TaxID=58331 RepID=UPI0032DECF7C